MIAALALLLLSQTTLPHRMEEAMGPFPIIHRGPVKVLVVEQRTKGSLLFQKITYESEPGDAVPAWLIRRTGLPKLPPGMLCLHQTTKFGKDEPAGFAGKPTLHYARELAERGFVVIAPDYPSLGENTSDPYAMRYVSTSMKGIWNHSRAIDVLVENAGVDASRIGSIGHSLGGHNSLFLAVFDPRVKVVVTSCGFTSMARYKGGNLKGWDGWRYMPRFATRYDNSPAKVPWDFSEVLSFLGDRAIFINAPLRDDNFDNSGVRDCVRMAGPKTVAVYPDVAHEFPDDIRAQAYDFIEKNLKPQ
jgi:dienelactone hydrolase